MKEITDYFSSPTKVRKSLEQVDRVESADQNVNTENKIEDNLAKVEISKGELPKRTKKVKRRKPTDPDVKIVTELLSNHLGLISPNSSETKMLKTPSSKEKNVKKVNRSSLESSVHNAIQNNKRDNNFSKTSDNRTHDAENVKTKNHLNSKPDDKEIKPTTSEVIEIMEAESNSQTPIDTSKVNAFQFMMNSRNNVIGQNSDGKTSTEQDTHFSGQKSKLNSRKDLFKNWADQKGALKRKREDEEIEKCINHKLEKRAKRLKKLIQGTTEEKIVKEKKSLKGKKTVKILQSSSDSKNSTDLAKTTSNKEPQDSSPPLLVDISEVIEENAQDTVLTICSSPPKKHHKENGQNNLLNFFGVLNKEPKEERIEVYDDSLIGPAKEFIKIKMFTPESTKKRTSLVSLNKDRAKSVTEESSQESVKIKKHKKKRKKHKDTEGKSQSETQLNDSLEDFCSPESKKSNMSIKKSTKTKKSKKNTLSNNTTEKEDTVNQSKMNKNKAINNEVKNCVSVERNTKQETSVDKVEMKGWDSENEDETKKKDNNVKHKEDRINQSEIIVNSIVDQEEIETFGLTERKIQRERTVENINSLVKEWDSDNDDEYNITCDMPNNKKDLLIDDSTKDSDIVQPKIKRNSKHCVLADDSDDSRSSEGQNLAVENSRAESPVIKTKVKTKSKLWVNDEDAKAHKTVVNNLKLVIDKSSRDSDINKRKSKEKNRSHIINYDDLHQEYSAKEPKSNRKSNIGPKAVENGLEGHKEEVNKPGVSESQGRVLRPKRKEINYTDIKVTIQKTPKTNKKENSFVKKSSTKSSDKNDSIEKVDLLSSESEYEEAPKKKVPAKVAPVFLKATPKPKLNPEIVEARKKFLMSGVPDTLKKTVEKQKSFEEKEYDVFPSISHIQQKCDNKFWNLPKPDLKYAFITSFSPYEQVPNFSDLIVRQTPYEVNITTEIENIKHMKRLLDQIKSENPNYPVYKVFRHIYEKSGKNFSKEKKTVRRRSKKDARKSSQLIASMNSESVLKDCEMWTEKYKPRTSDEILGNHFGVSKLKKWLEIWMNYSKEINSRGKRKRTNSNSESEFESTDCDSRDSTRLPGNTMILGGPCGSGKTSAVYAIANELGFNVLELNASSKRTGKRLLQELQEATQSHQVRKNVINITNYINPENTSNKGVKNMKVELKDRKTDSNEHLDYTNKKKMCILLIEDIDIVFDQDDGFLTSLSQLITTSKRPIILTTTDNSSSHVQKLLSQYEVISFCPLSLQCLGVWLQVLCLVEGLLVDKDDLGNLLEYNKGDIRKTLLEVQFWSQSGGQLEKTREFPFLSQNTSSSKTELKESDEELKVDLSDGDVKEDYFIHKHCIGSFEVLRENKEYLLPQTVNLGLLWWNMPSILNVSSCAGERWHRQKGRITENTSDQNKDTNISDEDIKRLNTVLFLYDAFTLSDSLLKSVRCRTSNEPVVKNWSTDIQDSLELTERKEDSNDGLEMVRDLTRTLMHGSIRDFRSIDDGKFGLNMALPDTHERRMTGGVYASTVSYIAGESIGHRWRAKQHICEDFLKEPIPLWNSLDRSSIALDYLPTLRDITRNEEKRAASNTKRGNRFRHYLKNLNMDFKESTCKLCCNILNLTDDDQVIDYI